MSGIRLRQPRAETALLGNGGNKVRRAMAKCFMHYKARQGDTVVGLTSYVCHRSTLPPSAWATASVDRQKASNHLVRDEGVAGSNPARALAGMMTTEPELWMDEAHAEQAGLPRE